jgi:ethanolamine utilization cobalamin adenosyltransferase
MEIRSAFLEVVHVTNGRTGGQRDMAKLKSSYFQYFTNTPENIFLDPITMEYSIHLMPKLNILQIKELESWNRNVYGIDKYKKKRKWMLQAVRVLSSPDQSY